MSPRFVNLICLSLLIAPVLSLSGGMASAWANTVRPFAPWMTLQDGMDDSLAAQKAAPAVHTTGTREFAATRKTPNVPVITPRDTIDLINQIYEK